MDSTSQATASGLSTFQDTSTSSSSLSSQSSSSELATLSLPGNLLLKLQGRLETVEKEMTHVVGMKEEMDGLKEGMNKVKEEMGDFRDEISGLNADMKKVKKTKGKIANLQKRVEEYEESWTEMEETISAIRTDHDELSGQVRQLSDNYEETRVKNHGWLRKFEDRLYKHEQSSRSVTVQKSLFHKQVEDLNSELTRCVARVDEIDKRRQPEVAVHARRPRDSYILKFDTLVCFTELVTNKGGHYDPSSGVFTAPVDGVYMTSLVHQQIDKKCVWLKVCHTEANPGSSGVKEKMVCETWTNVKQTSCTDVSIVWMSAGDTLYVKVKSNEADNMEIGFPSSFSCILIQ